MADRSEGRASAPRGTVESVAERLPLAIGVLLGSVALSAVFEFLRFPERRVWMVAFAAWFALLSGGAWFVRLRRPRWTIEAILTLVNVVGAGINAYHVIVAAPIWMCVWVLTALIAGCAFLLPWGPRNQALASVGVLVTYPAHLAVGSSDPLVWTAGGAYLLMVVAISTLGSSLFASHLKKGLRLTAALSEREARLQSYFDLSLVGMAIVGADGRCREVNEELCRMLGASPATLLGTSWTARVDPVDEPFAAHLLARALAGEPRRADVRLLGTEGTIHATVAMRGLPGPRGTVDHAMILVHDISERRRMELERERSLEDTEAACRRAEEANRAKDAFFATVSHELRTPLTPILAWANLLQSGDLGVSRTARAVSAIRRNAYAQARIIDDLLDMSRIVAGEWEFDFRPVDLVAIARASVEVMQPAADAKRIKLVAELPERTLAVRGDADRLQQVAWNLISNAIKFTPHGGRIAVSVRSGNGKAELAVHDTGEGIAPEFVEHVFEPFRQADASPSRRHGGLGLGLAIVRVLVERHEGTVRVESAGKRQGTTFTVELAELPEGLPSEDPVGAERSRTVAPSMSGPRAALRGLKVLVVDDDADSNAVVKALLAARGAEVHTVLSAAEGLAMADLWRPDVVVSDIAMPGEDGIAFLHALRERRETIGNVPAIALTAYASAAEKHQLLDAGFQAHVAKPFDPVHLAAVVETTAYAVRAS